MKNVLFILFLFIAVTAQGQITPTGPKWKYTPNSVEDSTNIRNYFKLQGERFVFSSASDGQALIRDGGIWKNMALSTIAYDSAHFTVSTGILAFYKAGTVVMSATLNDRFPTFANVNDTIDANALTKAVYDTLGIGGQIVNQDSTQTLSRKTLLVPVIESFKSAMHNHSDSINGGLLSDDYRSVFSIVLPSSGTVGGRCASPTEIPSGWSVAADAVTPTNLVVSHHLHRHISYVSVFTVSGTAERQLFGNAAYAGIYAPNDSTLHVESLATITSAIRINLIFK